MSICGTWKCPRCGKEWTGRIAWMPPEPEFEKWLVFHCGCEKATNDITRRGETCR